MCVGVRALTLVISPMICGFKSHRPHRFRGYNQQRHRWKWFIRREKYEPIAKCRSYLHRANEFLRSLKNCLFLLFDHVFQLFCLCRVKFRQCFGYLSGNLSKRLYICVKFSLRVRCSKFPKRLLEFPLECLEVSNCPSLCQAPLLSEPHSFVNYKKLVRLFILYHFASA